MGLAPQHFSNDDGNRKRDNWTRSAFPMNHTCKKERKKTKNVIFFLGGRKKNTRTELKDVHRGYQFHVKTNKGWILNHLQYVLALLLCFFTHVFPDSLELWRFVQFCQILTFSKYQNLVLIKISVYKKLFPNKIMSS